MAALARSTERSYRHLLSDLDAAYKGMSEASRELNAAFAQAGLSQAERMERIHVAGRAFDDARQQCMAAVARLNQFNIRKIVSLHFPVRRAVPSSIAIGEAVGLGVGHQK